MGMAASIPYYTVEDLERFPDDGNRYELLDGVLLVTPAPNAEHQLIAAMLIARLLVAVEPLGVARVVGPGAIACPPRTQLEPDVLVYPRRFPRGTPWSQITEHWLAVEIYSPSSRIYDREFKRAAYVNLGVREIWLVDADAQTVEVCRAIGTSQVVRDRVTWAVPETDHHVVIELAGLFEDAL